MKKMVLGCAAAAALMVGASAQNVPKLSEFLLSCSRDSGPCKLKVKDFVTAATSQKSICLPKDISISEASTAVLRWLKSDEITATMKEEAFDDALYDASIKLYPCAPAVPPPEPPPPADAPAAAPPPQ